MPGRKISGMTADRTAAETYISRGRIVPTNNLNMNKFHFKLLFAATAVMAAVSCTGEQKPEPETYITVSACFGEDLQMSSQADNNSTLLWENGDELKLFWEGESGRAGTTLSEPSPTAEFSGKISGMFSPSSGSHLFALYPYREDARFGNDAIYTELPDVQESRSGSSAKDNSIFVASSETTDLSFLNVCGGIRFSLKNDDIREIVLKGMNEEKIAGDVSISYKDGIPVAECVGDGLGEITLKAPEGGCFKAGEWYCMAVLPCTFKYGISLTFNTDTRKATAKLSDVFPVLRGVFKDMEDADGGLVFIEKSSEPWNDEQLSIDERLLSLPDVVSVQESGMLDNDYGFTKEIMFRLPIDHDDPSKGYFLNLVEAGINHPDSLNVATITGYQSFWDKDYIAELFDGNQFVIEHRDFINSGTGADYEYLNSYQAAEDQKQIISDLQLMFGRRFAVTGSSKGGICTALLAGYHPELDIVYVPKVAPFCRRLDDPKGHTFDLEKVGTAALRARVDRLQRKMLALMDNDDILNEFKSKVADNPYKPDMSVKDYFYYSVQEYGSSFWQNGGDESTLPDESLEGLRLWKAVENVLTGAGDLNSFVYMIQATRELGNFGYNHNFTDIYQPECTDYALAQIPEEFRKDYDGGATFAKYIDEAVASTDRPMYFLYGGQDHWTEWAIDDKYINGTNVRKYILPDGLHSLSIDNIKDEQKKREIEEWLSYYMRR